ncbi:uncharacterized protein E5676_scaffold1163G00660 [Cucumis melo var. makuwa]|uniref:Reverse transcriptase n=1 Tax=Cucumis melo var. makuwa TaxID=1194695 RepID=A0A5D3DGK6_CUCMM|nr:uncharacterized protein E6C27_scaffold43052G00900 [Cucumis melo var. makuwa]TYK22736.1 uncharacterized protein E5676_scaffold1163G00660 [Cucumis melo var. makuwa]
MVDSGATYNFITEAEARRLRLRWEKDSRRMKAVNSVALPIVGLVKRTTIKFGGWKGPVDFVVVKMDDFDVVLGMEFLLEHQVILMPSAKYLTIIGSFPMSPTQEEPSSAAILLEALETLRETVPKDTLCVPEKCHDVLPNSWPKSVSMQRTIDHGIELLPKAKASAKNAYRIVSPDLAKLRKPSRMLLNTGFSRPIQASYGVHVLSLKKKDRSPQQHIDRRIQSKFTVRRKYPFPMLTRRVNRLRGVKYLPKSDIRPRYCRVRTTKARGLKTTCVTGHEAYKFPVCHQSGLLREEDTQWSENRECQAAFNGSKQAMIEEPSLGVVDAAKTPKVEAEQFSYFHIKRSPFEIKGNRHSVLSSLADGPYVGDCPQVHRVGEEWEQMADIARVCLEEASRSMEEREDREVEEVLADRVRTGRRPTREIHKFLVKQKKPLVEVTSGGHVEDLEAWMQKTEELQLRQLTRTSTV